MATAMAVVGAAFAMFIVGLADDTLTLTPLGKLVASLAVGAFYVFGLIAVTPQAAPTTVSALIAIVWFGGVVHTLNLLDNMDGLAGGVAVVACLFFVWVYGPNLGPAVVALLVAVSGSLIGFLIPIECKKPFNFHIISYTASNSKKTTFRNHYTTR